MFNVTYSVKIKFTRLKMNVTYLSICNLISLSQSRLRRQEVNTSSSSLPLNFLLKRLIISLIFAVKEVVSSQNEHKMNTFEIVLRPAIATT